MYLVFESGTFKALPLGKTFEETRGQVLGNTGSGL